MRQQIPFIRKESFPGGVTDLIDRKSEGAKTSGPDLDKGKNIDLGDILSFNYIGREIIDGEFENTGETVKPNDKVVLNPLIVFGGYDASSGCIMGVDLKRFKMEKQNSGLTETFRLLRKYYYYLEETDGRKMWKKRTFREVPYNGPIAFKYDNFGAGWSSCGKLLTRYFKLYKPNLMRSIIIMPPDIAEIECNGTVRALPGKLK